MLVHEFRKDLKKCFDRALSEPVYIERGGIVFKLENYGPVTTAMKELVIDRKSMDTATPSMTMRAEVVEREYFCKNGHRANEYGRCLQKDCKYA